MLEFLCFFPRVGSGDPRNQMRPSVERRDRLIRALISPLSQSQAISLVSTSSYVMLSFNPHFNLRNRNHYRPFTGKETEAQRG